MPNPENADLDWQSSFQWPVDPPTVDPFTPPLRYMCFSSQWAPYVLGALAQLMQESAWSTTDQAVLDLTLQRADTLIAGLIEDCPMIAPGLIMLYAGDTAPDGWLFCDGAAVSRTTYAALFAAIASTFGDGDGSTTFNLPDIQGRVPVGVGSGTGLTTRNLADTGGEEAHVLTVSELASHSHDDAGHVHSEGTATPTLINGGLEAPASSAFPSVGLTGTGYASLGNTGSDDPHNTMPPFIALNYCIRF